MKTEINNTLIRIISGVAAIAASGFLLSACMITSTTPQSPETIYHHTWWNYYERARLRLQNSNTQGAISDLKICMGLQPGAKYGYPKDQWRARTYGVHFIESYFPNRELGICLFNEGQLKDAKTFLEASMSTAPSGRAKYFLNEVHRQQLQNMQVSTPVIEIPDSSMTRWTNKRNLSLQGVAHGKGRIAALAINGVSEFVELAEQTLPFARSVALTPGLNKIVVEVVDLTGQRASKLMVCNADWAVPSLTIKKMIRHNDGSLSIDLLCEDNMGLASVTMNNQHLALPKSDINKQLTRTISLKPDDIVTLKITDLAGNSYHKVLSSEVFASVDEGNLISGHQLASSAGGESVSSFTLPSLLPLTATTIAADTMRPSLRLGGIKDSSVVFKEEFFVDGEISDGGGLRSVTINGEPLLSDASLGAVKQCFSRRIELGSGTNTFSIVATDMNGNSTTKSFTVIKKDPEYLAEQYRLSVGVPPLRQQGNPAVAEAIKFTIEDELLREPARFNLLERDEGWDYIMREQQLSISDLADSRVALKIGSMLPAEMLFLGSVIEEESGITVFVRLVSTESGQVLLTEDVYSQSQDKLDYQTSGLVMKIEQRFPLVSGRIVEKHGGKVVLNLGTQDGISRGTRFLVIQPRPPKESIESGLVCMHNDALVQLDIARAKSTSGTATIRPPDAAEAIKEGDHVYAR